jgi:hypothetical protein
MSRIFVSPVFNVFVNLNLNYCNISGVHCRVRVQTISTGA